MGEFLIQKTLHSCRSESIVEQVMRISIEDPKIVALEFEEIMDICKEYNYRTPL